MPDTKNIHNLYWLNAINHGADEAIVATVAPIPRDTNAMGRAQQSSVPEVENSNSQLHVRGLSCGSLFIMRSRWVLLINGLPNKQCQYQS